MDNEDQEAALHAVLATLDRVADPDRMNPEEYELLLEALKEEVETRLECVRGEMADVRGVRGARR